MAGKHRLVVLLALLGLVPAAGLPAQEPMWFGDLQVAGQDALSSADPVNASAIGIAPWTQGLAGLVQLDLHGRLTYPRGQLSFMDTATWWQGFDGGTLQNDLLQAWISFSPLPALTVVAGKQRIPWATGYAFSPGDRINPAVNPQNRAEGFYGVSVTLAPSASLSLTGAVRMDQALAGISVLPGLPYSSGSDAAAALPFLAPYLHPAPANPWIALRYALYVEAFLGALDLHAAAAWQPARLLRPTAGFSLDVLGFILDGSVAVELSDSALYPQADGTYASPGFASAYLLGTVGLQRTASWESGSFAVTVEYLYDATGYDPGQEGKFLSDLETALAAGGGAALSAGSAAGSAWFSSGDIVPALGRHYGALSVSASVSGWFTTNAALLVNLQDQSLAVQAEVLLTPLEGIDLFIRGIGAGGSSTHTEFGSLPVAMVATAGAIMHF